ncbi:MAG: nicotinate-nucleotide--dimethylbenzimidazole phosphoribosyltransferase [Planctomycetaceae bacterium]|jgi:nicotinate-nucleotide--dimethylbenzimidazole phosphoribosyltransferase|nr:nicotinate-nucleotide--dimethylbenzimidazole phosphoribosyltransferase [Planctomycetaceae bacterium]
MLSPTDIQTHLDQLTKPPGSLARLENLATRLAEIQQTLSPVAQPRRMVLFAGDHGVVASGVSAWPSAVTALMVGNILGGGAASSVLAKQSNTDLVLVNVGVKGELNGPVTHNSDITYVESCVRKGTRDLSLESAMTVAEFDQAWQVGEREAERAVKDGIKVISCGEMGIGNTTSAACLSMLLADLPLEYSVGRGAGADDEMLAHKRTIVAEAVDRAKILSDKESIASVAGYEIIAMAGLMAHAAQQGLTIVLDGYVTTAAALIAERLHPGTSQHLIAAHLSAEPGHRLTLNHLGLQPFLEWDMRLGEGSGALLLMPMLDAAAALMSQMATFADLGIPKEATS